MERDVPADYAAGGQLALLLRDPDFTTAQRITDTINRQFGAVAYPVDAGRVVVNLPGKHLPNKVKRIFAKNNITVYYINAIQIAREIGLGNRTNTILQSAFFRITNTCSNAIVWKTVVSIKLSVNCSS